MKHYFIILAVAVFITTNSFSQTHVTLAEAGKHVGDTVRICEKVISSNAIMATEGKPTVLILGNADSTTSIQIVIMAESRKRFDYKPEKDLLNRNVCITGKLELIDGKMMIVVHKQDDINIVK